MFSVCCPDPPLPSILPVLDFLFHLLVRNFPSSAALTLRTASCVRAKTSRGLRLSLPVTTLPLQDLQQHPCLSPSHSGPSWDFCFSPFGFESLFWVLLLPCLLIPIRGLIALPRVLKSLSAWAPRSLVRFRGVFNSTSTEDGFSLVHASCKSQKLPPGTGPPLGPPAPLPLPLL